MSPPETKKMRRIHMDASSCSEYANSSEGIKPLAAPVTIEKSSKDPNRGLYPKTGKTEAANCSTNEDSCPSFCKASDVYIKRKRCPSPEYTSVENETSLFAISPDISPESSVAGTDSLLTVESEPASKRKKKNFSFHSNKITNYMTPSNSTDYYVNNCAENNGLKSEVVTVHKSDKVSHDLKSQSVKSNKGMEDFESFQLPSTSGSSSISKELGPDKDYYGLFGATEVDEVVGPDYFSKLPLELMERIFCQLPFVDLQSCKLVCHQWNDVISSERFIYWKTTYYNLKHGSEQDREIIDALLSSIDGHSANNCLQALVRFMKDSFSRKPASDMYDKLKKHKKLITAEKVLKERFPEWNQNLNPWCVVATLVLVSEEVKDVSDILRHLLNADSESLEVDVLEALYCIATFLLYCMNVLHINHGLHYRVYYALYTYENYIPAAGIDDIQNFEAPGQQSMHNYCTSMRLTYEQKRIVSHHLQRGDIIKIVAFAGSGKTSTLIELARRHPHFKFLNIMFNKSVCEHAQKLFPRNVRCQTAHSLAFTSGIGKSFARRLVSKLSPDVIKRYLKLSQYSFESLSYCKAVILTLQNFMASSDTEIAIKHTPEAKPSSSERVIFQPSLSLDQRLHVCNSAAVVWKLMADRAQNIPITHDAYLKVYQLSKPVINQYHCIMVDEAQDCSAAMLDIVLCQKAPVILVGDPHQQIYAFRGSKNALNTIKSTHTYHLTKSFRFGPEIAYIASCCIEVLKKYKEETLVGCDKPGTVSGAVTGQYAIIARSNLGLFNEAIRLCCLQNFRHEDEPRSIHGAFMGGIENYGLEQIEDIYRLKAMSGKPPNEVAPENRPRDKLIKVFQSFRSLISHAEKKDDAELLYKIELVLQYTDRIPEFIATLRRKCSTPMELANVVFTTAHKAKGFEFDTVRLAEDYNVARSPVELITKDCEEEYNILYVALTRAKSSLFLTEKLYNVLLLAQEKFEYPVLSEDVQNQSPLNCVLCFTPVKPHTILSLVRRKITLTTGRVLKEGLLCMKCGAAPYYRPQIIRNPIIMYLDPMEDFAHRSLKFLVGPLPSDPPIPDDYDRFQDFRAMDIMQIINIPL